MSRSNPLNSIVDICRPASLVEFRERSKFAHPDRHPDKGGRCPGDRLGGPQGSRLDLLFPTHASSSSTVHP